MKMVLLCMISRASEEVDLGVICAAEGRPRATHDTSIRLEPCNCSSSASRYLARPSPTWVPTPDEEPKQTVWPNVDELDWHSGAGTLGRQ
jgi:hypothetical protein